MNRLKKLWKKKDGVNIFLSEGAGQETILRELESKGNGTARCFSHARSG